MRPFLVFYYTILHDPQGAVLSNTVHRVSERVSGTRQIRIINQIVRKQTDQRVSE